jgi:hypothetical protein
MKIEFENAPQNVLEGFKNASRFRDETSTKNPPKKLATPDGKSQLGPNCPNSKATEKSLVKGNRKVDYFVVGLTC